MQAAVGGSVKNLLPKGIVHNCDAMHIAGYKPLCIKLPAVAAVKTAIYATDFNHSPDGVVLERIKQDLRDPCGAHVDL